jgi:hypothetical protein
MGGQAPGPFVGSESEVVIQDRVHGLKLLAATALVFVGGWLLIMSHGEWLAIRGDHPEWYPLPSHAIARMAGYLTAAVLLQFLSAWLLSSDRAGTGRRDWPRYGLEVIGCICGCFIAVVVILVVALFFCSDC